MVPQGYDVVHHPDVGVLPYSREDVIVRRGGFDEPGQMVDLASHSNWTRVV